MSCARTSAEDRLAHARGLALRLGSYSCLELFQELTLHLAAWGSPDFDLLPEHDRTAMAEAVDRRTTTYSIKVIQQACIYAEVPLKDAWLSESLSAAALIDSRVGLRQNLRDSLAISHCEMGATLIRLEVRNFPKPSIRVAAPSTDAPFPVIGWEQIIHTLNGVFGSGLDKFKNNRKTQYSIRRLNDEHAGPIRFGGKRGKPPTADKNALRQWWMATAAAIVAEGATLAGCARTLDTFEQGSRRTAVPEINGRVQKRKKA